VGQAKPPGNPYSP